jgi:putative SOS response-associated peptidase YedK
MPVDEALDDDETEGAPRQSYNFAPGYHGVVYRADVPDWGAGSRPRNSSTAAGEDIGCDDADIDEPVNVEKDAGPATPHNDTSTRTRKVAAGAKTAADPKYKLQSMKWGLIPFWTKRNPDYGSMMKTINCRDDSLAHSGGMWASMKGRKRCIVVAQGFYEWLKKDGSKDKMPHFVKRSDGKLMCLAGLWDVVQYESWHPLPLMDRARALPMICLATDIRRKIAG